MFYINDEKVNLATAAKSDNLIAKQIAEEIVKLQATISKKPMRIKWREGIMTLNRKSRLKEGKKMVFTPFATNVNNEQGTNRVVFCEQAQVGKFGEIKYFPKGEAFKGTRVLGINDLELAVYYKLFCPYVKSRTLIIEDREAEARERTEARQKIASYYFYLYNEASPLANDTERQVTIAKAFGIQNADTLGPNTLKEEIFKAIELREALSKDGIITFQRFIESEDPMLKPLSDIQTLVDDGQLYIDRNDHTWKTKDKSKFFQLNPTESFDIAVAKKKLAMFLLSDKSAYDIVIAMIEGSNPPPKIVIDENTDLEALEWNVLRNAAKSLGIVTYKKQAEMLIYEIKEKLKKNE